MGAVKHLFVIHFTLLVDNYCCFIAGVAGTIEHDPAELHSSLNFLPDEAVDLDNGAGRKQAVAVGGAELHSSPNFPPEESVDLDNVAGRKQAVAVDGVELHSSPNFPPDEAVDLDNVAGRKQAVAVGGADLHSSLNFPPEESVDLDNVAGRTQAVAVGGADLHSSPNFPPDEAVDGYYATSGLQWSAAVDLPSTFPVVDQTSPVTLLLSLKQCGLAPDTEILVSKAFLEELLESGTGLYICISLYFGLWCHIPA